MFRTVPLSIIRSFALYTDEWYMSYRFADSCQQTPVGQYGVYCKPHCRSVLSARCLWLIHIFVCKEKNHNNDAGTIRWHNTRGILLVDQARSGFVPPCIRVVKFGRLDRLNLGL